MPKPTPLSLGSAFWHDCQIVGDFLEQEVIPRVTDAAGDTPNEDATMFQGLLFRTLFWMRSVGVLDSPAFFQAVAGGCRTMFEIAVDVALMHFDPNNASAKMHAWEDSAKLNAAEKISRYFADAGQEVPSLYDGQMGFIQNDRERVIQLRTRYWEGVHPRQRWTGRDLSRDATAAHAFLPEARFTEFYATRYSEVCWSTHGSGLAGFRNIPEDMFPAIAAQNMRDAGRFAILAAKLTAQHFNVWDDLEPAFDGVEVLRTMAQYAASHDVPFDAVRKLYEENPNVSPEEALRLTRELEQAPRLQEP